MMLIGKSKELDNFFFFFNDTATTEIYTLSLHDALPISRHQCTPGQPERFHAGRDASDRARSEEHTSELQSPCNLVCRLLLEKKNNIKLLRRITRTENILHRNFTRRQVAIQNRVASNIGIIFFFMIRQPPRSTLFPYPTLFR